MQVENVTFIEASQATVWSVTVDIERWPQWTPTVTRATIISQGPFDVGSEVRIKQPGLPEAKWRITELKTGSGFTWESRIRGMHMVATHALQPMGYQTQNTLRMDVSGLTARLLWPWIKTSIRKALEQENKGLKTVCELK